MKRAVRSIGLALLLWAGARGWAGPSDIAIGDLVAQARAQYLAGESAAAAETFRQVQAIDPTQADARYFLGRIERESRLNERSRASERMMTEVDQAWRRADGFPGSRVDRPVPHEA